MQIVNCLDSINICFWNIFTLIFSIVGCIPCIGALITFGGGSILTTLAGVGTAATVPVATTIAGIPITIGAAGATVTIGTLTIPASVISFLGGPIAGILCDQIAAIGEATCNFLIHYPLDVRVAYTENWVGELIASVIMLISHLLGGQVTGETAKDVSEGITGFFKPILEAITGG